MHFSPAGICFSLAPSSFGSPFPCPAQTSSRSSLPLPVMCGVWVCVELGFLPSARSLERGERRGVRSVALHIPHLPLPVPNPLCRRVAAALYGFWKGRSWSPPCLMKAGRAWPCGPSERGLGGNPQSPPTPTQALQLSCGCVSHDPQACPPPVPSLPRLPTDRPQPWMST